MDENEKMVAQDENKADKPITKAQLQELAEQQAAEIAALKAELAAKPVPAPVVGYADTAEGRNAYLNERIPFKAIKDNGMYKDDVVVIVNGTRFQIQRGKVVFIPRYVYLAIDDAERQMADSSDIISAYAERTEERFAGL